MNIEYSWRYTLVGMIFALVGMLIIGQMFRIQIFYDDETFPDPKTMGQQERAASYRGLVMDRNGHLLAGNHTVYTVSVSISEWESAIQDKENKLAPEDIGYVMDSAVEVFEITNPALLEIMRQEPYPQDLSAVEVAQYASPEQVERFLSYVYIIQHRSIQPEVEEKKLPEIQLVNCDPALGVYCDPHFGRIYPEGKVAANILGFIKRDTGQGYLGVEGKYETTLMGDNREFMALWDPHKADQVNTPEHGASLVLTIDSILQHDVEKILDRAVKHNGAVAGTIVVMNPKTGEIYAMASNPRVNSNYYWEDQYSLTVNNKDNIYNYAIKSYEPGSVFKIFTMAAALDNGTVTPETEFLDTGEIQIGGITIRNWDRGAWGPQTMTTCLQHSLNVCLAWVSQEVGAEDYYEYMEAFGFGQLTGIGLANEPSGIVRSYKLAEGWSKSVLATNSFGQGIEATPIQLLQAASAIANNGQMVTPRIVKAIIDDGYQYDAPVRYAGQPISEETASTLTQMLAVSLEEEASTALVSGYALAGKTGTAEIFVPGKGYTTNLTNASFIGWGPIDDPQFMVYVWFEKPTASIWGSVIASPVFHDVVVQVVNQLDIPPDEVRFSLQDDF